MIERFLDDISNYWKSVICVGSGNEGTSAGLTAGMLSETTEEEIILGVQMNEPAVNVQLWKSYVDEVDISLVSPSGIRVGPIIPKFQLLSFDILPLSHIVLLQA